METVDKFQYFLYVTDFFKFNLELSKTIGLREPNRDVLLLPIHPSIAITKDINQAAFYITRALEGIKNSILDKETFESFCDYLVKKYKLDEKLSYDEGTSSSEIIESFRNCLAHSNYFCNIVFNGYGYDENKSLVHVNNHKINGEIDIRSIFLMTNNLNLYFERLPFDEVKYYDIEKICNIRTTNKQNYEIALNTLKKQVCKVCEEPNVEYVTNDKNGIPFVQIGACDFTEEFYYLNQEEVELVKLYIDYYGLNKWIKLSPEQRKFLLDNVIITMSLGNMSYDLDRKIEGFIANIMRSGFNSNFNVSMKIDGVSAKYFAPIMYSSQAISYSFYILNYLKETSMKEGIGPLLCRNIDVDKFKFNNLSKDDYVKYVNNADIEIQYNNSVTKEQQLENSIEKLKNSITSIESSNKNLEEKERIINILKKEIEETQVHLDKRKEISIELRNKKEESAYYNCTELFRRLRNSVSHGKYSFNYIDALKTKNMENLKIRFYDNEGNQDYSFDVEIKVADLLDVFKQLIDNMKHNAKYFQDDKEIEVGVIADVPKDLLDSYFENMSDNSNVIYKTNNSVMEVGNIYKNVELAEDNNSKRTI